MVVPTASCLLARDFENSLEDKVQKFQCLFSMYIITGGTTEKDSYQKGQPSKGCPCVHACLSRV